MLVLRRRTVLVFVGRVQPLRSFCDPFRFSSSIRVFLRAFSFFFYGFGAQRQRFVFWVLDSSKAARTVVNHKNFSKTGGFTFKTGGFNIKQFFSNGLKSNIIIDSEGKIKLFFDFNSWNSGWFEFRHQSFSKFCILENKILICFWRRKPSGCPGVNRPQSKCNRMNLISHIILPK